MLYQKVGIYVLFKYYLLIKHLAKDLYLLEFYELITHSADSTAHKTKKKYTSVLQLCVCVCAPIVLLPLPNQNTNSFHMLNLEEVIIHCILNFIQTFIKKAVHSKRFPSQNDSYFTYILPLSQCSWPLRINSFLSCPLYGWHRNSNYKSLVIVKSSICEMCP